MKHPFNGTFAQDHQRKILYRPERRPGFTAWTAVFDYGDGRLGLSFKEIVPEENLAFRLPPLELGEVLGSPVSYGGAVCGGQRERSLRVFLLSEDGGASWRESGRAPLEDAPFCCIGMPDGRILGLETPALNAERTGCGTGIEVRESLDGGSTWRVTARLLDGCAPYLWRVRRLRDGSFLLLASLYGTPWGTGLPRSTRNTMLPGETYLNKIQTFLLHSRDGISFSGPHYVLPGTGAHEYDAAELSDGSILLLAGDVQATPPARQLIRREGERFINGPLLPIGQGAPPDPEKNPQGGILPETFVCLEGDLLVGARRNKPFTCSADQGANWFPLEGAPAGLYQPCLQRLPDGSLGCFGHFGGDAALGQADMYIAADFFRAEGRPPAMAQLSLERLLTEDQRQYRNAFSAVLTQNGQPLAGERTVFRFVPYWTPDGAVSTLPQADAPIQIEAVTDASGYAEASVAEFDRAADIHFAYSVDAWTPGEPERGLLPCASPLRCELAMTPRRQDPRPYPAYFAEGTLYVSQELEAAFPDIFRLLAPLQGPDPEGAPGDLPAALVKALLDAHVLRETESGPAWIPSVHAPCPLADIKPMGEGDLYC